MKKALISMLLLSSVANGRAVIEPIENTPTLEMFYQASCKIIRQAKEEHEYMASVRKAVEGGPARAQVAKADTSSVPKSGAAPVSVAPKSEVVSVPDVGSTSASAPKSTKDPASKPKKESVSNTSSVHKKASVSVTSKSEIVSVPDVGSTSASAPKSRKDSAPKAISEDEMAGRLAKYDRIICFLEATKHALQADHESLLTADLDGRGGEMEAYVVRYLNANPRKSLGHLISTTWGALESDILDVLEFKEKKEAFQRTIAEAERIDESETNEALEKAMADERKFFEERNNKKGIRNAAFEAFEGARSRGIDIGALEEAKDKAKAEFDSADKALRNATANKGYLMGGIDRYRDAIKALEAAKDKGAATDELRGALGAADAEYQKAKKNLVKVMNAVGVKTKAQKAARDLGVARAERYNSLDELREKFLTTKKRIDWSKHTTQFDYLIAELKRANQEFLKSCEAIFPEEVKDDALLAKTEDSMRVAAAGTKSALKGESDGSSKASGRELKFGDKVSVREFDKKEAPNVMLSEALEDILEKSRILN